MAKAKARAKAKASTTSLKAKAKATRVRAKASHGGRRIQDMVLLDILWIAVKFQIGKAMAAAFKNPADCKFFASGNCSKDDKCSFRHMQSGARAAPSQPGGTSTQQPSGKKNKKHRPSGSSSEEAKSQKSETERDEKKGKKNTGNAAPAFPIQNGMASAYAASSVSSFEMSASTNLLVRFNEAHSPNDTHDIRSYCYDGRFRPDVREHHWFCNGDPEGLPVHTEIVHRYWAVDHGMDKKQCYENVKLQIKNK